MELTAPAKVNLALCLGPTRADGRHELVTVFSALSLADRLTVSFGDVEADTVLCPGVEGPNLAADALARLRRAGWDAPPVRVTIDKRIPVAAGLGGGSSDAAAVLRLAADTGIDLLELARELGSDVAALVHPGLWLGRGAGDAELVRYDAGLMEHAYVVVPARGGLSTAAVYAEADRLGLGRTAAELAERDAALAAALAAGGRLASELIVNDLGAAAASLHPPVRAALDALAAAGAEDVLVSGSGPTCIGIWWGPRAFEVAEAAALELLALFPGVRPASPVLDPSQWAPR